MEDKLKEIEEMESKMSKELNIALAGGIALYLFLYVFTEIVPRVCEFLL